VSNDIRRAFRGKFIRLVGLSSIMPPSAEVVLQRSMQGECEEQEVVQEEKQPKANMSIFMLGRKRMSRTKLLCCQARPSIG